MEVQTKEICCQDNGKAGGKARQAQKEYREDNGALIRDYSLTIIVIMLVHAHIQSDEDCNCKLTQITHTDTNTHIYTEKCT